MLSLSLQSTSFHGVASVPSRVQPTMLFGAKASAPRPGYTPGDLGFDPLGFSKDLSADEFKLMQEKELAHARLAMIAAAGFLAQEAVTHATWGTVYGLPDF